MAMEMQDLLDSLDGRDLIYGISTAAKHIGGIAPCLSGSGSCPKDVFGLADAALWTKELEEAVSRLVYAIEKMHQNDVIEKSIRDGSGIQSGAVLEYDCVLSARAKDLDGDVLWQKGGMEIDPKMPLLWQHIRLQPIGKHLKVLDQDDDVTKASFAIADIPLGRDAAVLLKFGALRKSHGFIPREFRPNSVKKVDGKTIVTGWDVLKSYCVEGSLVSVPANPRADILKVYAKEFDGVCTAHSRGMLKSPAVVAWSKSVFDSRPSMELGADLDEKNCGTGDGGFKPGNHCAGGGGSGGSGAAVGGGAAAGKGGDSKAGNEPAKDGKKKKADDGGCGCRAHAAEAVAGVDQSVAAVAEKVDEAIKSIAGLQELISESTLGIVAGAKSLDEKKLPSPKAGEADDDFVGRCMHEAQGDFPDNKQRVAVCLGRRRKPKELGGVACKDLVESVTIESRASVQNDVNTSYLRGSWEWIQDVLRNDAKSFLRSSGVSMNYDSWAELLATFAQSCVLSLRDYTRDEVTGESKRRVRCFEVAWSTGSDGIPTLTGEPKAVTVGLEVKPKSFEAVLRLAQLGDEDALGLLSKAAGVSDLLRQHVHLEGFF